MTPACTAASALACPVPRVSWKCTPTGTPGQARRTASSSWTTRSGVVVPMVSPRHSWSAPAVTAARATSTVRATGVRPSNGQSQAVAMMTSSEPPAPCARPAISPTAATASAVDRPALARLCPSEAETTYSRLATPASTARTAPRALATSADQCTPGQRDSSAATASASASAGTAFGETNDVASIRRTPVATRASSISSFASSGTGASSWRPSRMPDLADVDGRGQDQVEVVHALHPLPRPRALTRQPGPVDDPDGWRSRARTSSRSAHHGGATRRCAVSIGPGALPTADRLSVFVNAPVGVASARPTACVLDANQALADCSGRPVTELTGRSIFDLVHPDDVAAAREAAASLTRHPEPADAARDAGCVRADGHAPCRCRSSASLRRTGDGEPGAAPGGVHRGHHRAQGARGRSWCTGRCTTR